MVQTTKPKRVQGRNGTQPARRNGDAAIKEAQVRLASMEQALAQREAELQVINSVQAGLASQLDMQAIYELVGDRIRDIFDANTVALATFDLEKNLMYRHYIIERGKRYQVGPTSISTTWHQFIQRGQSTLINNNLLEYMQRIDPDFKVIVGEMPKCSLSVPLKIRGVLSGVISLQNVDRENAFSESDQRLLETLANSLSAALENARLFDEAQQRNEELALINRVQEALASKLEMQAIYELIGEKVREVFQVEVIDIVNYDPIANLISMPYSYEKGDRSVISPREPYGFRKQVIESRAPLLINQNFEALASQYNNPLLTGAWPKSALFMPLLVEDQVRSIISIQDLEHENAFSPTDVRLLQTLSNAMSVALENARLFNETQRLLVETEHRAQELATINTVGSALAGELNLPTLIELVGEQVRKVFRADIAYVALLDREKHVINFPYQYGEPADPIPWGEGLTSKIIQSGQPLLINEDMDRQRQQMQVTLIGKRAQSFLGVPIFVGGEAIGVVSVQSTKQKGRFTENDRRLLSTIAANVGIAFQNARLFLETQRLFQAERQAHEQAETLRSVAQALNRSLSLTEVFELVLTEIQKVIPYDSAGIYQVHENRRVFAAGRGFANLADLIGVSFEFDQQEDEIGYLISKSLQPLILEDAPEKYPQYFSTGSHAATKIRSYMAVPIVLNQELIGMITLDREESGFYTHEHADLALAFAAQAATAINNARLWEQEKMYRKALQRELEIGREIQAGFLPEALPQVNGWEIAALLMSAREVAGDFYDAFELPDGMIGLVIADVCDKGVGAALFMTLFRSLIRVTATQKAFEHTEEASASSRVADRLLHAITLTNTYIAETHGDSGMFATIFFGILDPSEGRLTYINGGHEPPLIIRSGAVSETLLNTGPAVGAVLGGRFETLETQLNSGDMLFAFTDGVPEAQNPQGKFFGHKRLLDLLHRDSESSHALIQSIKAELHQYIDAATQFDDITLLVVKRI